MDNVSIVLPPSTRERLKIVSRYEHKSVSELVREFVDYALEAREQGRLKRMYAGLRTLQGIGTPGITDASTTIDDTLYGENGVWKGSNAT